MIHSNLKHGLGLRFLASGILAVGLLAAAPSNAAEPSGFRLTYDIYVGGIYSMRTDVVVAMDQDSYSIELHMEKDGLPAIFSPMFTIDASAQGLRDGDSFKPAYFRTEYRKEKKYRWSEIAHGSEETRLKAAPDPVVEDEREAIASDLQRRSLDPLSSFAWMLERAETRGDCTAEGLVFDGRRLYEMTMIHLAGEEKNGSFFCEMKLGWLAGFTDKERRQAPYPDGLKFTLVEAYKGGPIVPRLIEAKIGMGEVRAKLDKVRRLSPEQVAAKLPLQ